MRRVRTGKRWCWEEREREDDPDKSHCTIFCSWSAKRQGKGHKMVPYMCNKDARGDCFITSFLKVVSLSWPCLFPCHRAVVSVQTTCPSLHQSEPKLDKQATQCQGTTNAHRKDLLELSNTLTGLILSVARRDRELEGQWRSVRHPGELRTRE